MNQNNNVIIVIITIAAFFGGYFIISKLINFASKLRNTSCLDKSNKKDNP